MKLIKQSIIFIFCILMIAFAGTGQVFADAENTAIPGNFDFEKGKQGFGGDYSVVNQNPHSGTACLQQFYKPGDTWNCVQSLPPLISCKAGETFELSVWSRNTVTAGDVLLGIRFIKFVNDVPQTLGYKWKAVGNNIPGWTRYSLIFKTPEGTEALAVYFRVGETVASGEVYWDDISLARTKEIELSSNNPNSNAENTAIPGNFDFEKGKQGFGGDYSVVNQNPHSGTACLQQFYKPGDTWNCVQSLPPLISCKAGETFELSVWSRNTVTAGDVLLGIRFIKFVNDVPQTLGYKWKAVGNNIPGWTRYSLIFKTPEGTEALAVYFRVGETVASGEVYWDDISLARTKEIVQRMTLQPLTSAVIFRDRQQELFDYNKKQMVKVNAEDVSLNLAFNGKNDDCNVNVELLNEASEKPVYRKTFKMENDHNCLSVPLGLNTLPPGRYTLTASLIKADKIVGKESKAIIINSLTEDARQLEPVKESSVDKHGNILVNGKPMIMVFYYHGPWILPAMFGANTAQVGGGSSIDGFYSNVDTAWKSGQYSWAGLYSELTFDHKIKKWKDKELTEAVTRLREHPGVIGWSLCDEPDGQGIPIEEVMRAKNIIRKLDSNHLIWVNLCLPNKFSEYSLTTDLASYDAYPFPDASLSVIAENNKAIMVAQGQTVKPLLSCLQAYSPPGNRAPTYEEIRAEAYLCITQGMKAFAFYSWSDPDPMFSLNKSMELQSYIQDLVMQVNILKDFLIAPDPVQPVISELDKNGIRYLFKTVNDKSYLITVNPEAKAKNYKFTLPEYRNVPVELLFDANSNAKVSNKQVEETMPSLGVKIYLY